MWAIPLKNKNSKTITNDLQNILTTSKGSPVKSESDRALEFYNSIFQNYLRGKNIQDYSRFTGRGPSIAERVIRSIRNLLKSQCLKKEMLIGYLNYHLLLQNKITQFIIVLK